MVLMTDVKLELEEMLFDCGADDVVAGNQASARPLTRRISAHFRRLQSPAAPKRTIRLRDTVVDLERREVCCNGSVRRLPGITAEMLRYFIANPNRRSPCSFCV